MCGCEPEVAGWRVPAKSWKDTWLHAVVVGHVRLPAERHAHHVSNTPFSFTEMSSPKSEMRRRASR